jgi:cyclic pyranopterin phosphate synthase
MAGKRTSDLIPLCHPVVLTDLLVRAVPDRAAGVVRIRVETATIGPSGVEMEALTAAAVAALTVYDMVREMDRSVAIRAVRLQRSEEPVSGPPPRAPRGARVAGRIAGAPPRGSFGGRVPPRRHGS